MKKRNFQNAVQILQVYINVQNVVSQDHNKIGVENVNQKDLENFRNGRAVMNILINLLSILKIKPTDHVLSGNGFHMKNFRIFSIYRKVDLELCLLLLG